MTVSVAESSPARNKPSVKKTLLKGHKRTVTRTKETAAYTDCEATDKTVCTAASEEQSKCKQLTNNCTRRSSRGKMLLLPQTGLLEHFLAKLTRPAYVAKMKKRLVKYEGRVRRGKDVIHISRKNLARLLRLLDKVANTDGVKSNRKNARKISKLLQTGVDA